MNDTVVETTYGKVRGTNSGPAFVWKGIPYASPPLGKLRFHPPQPPVAWQGVREATAFGSIAPQDFTHVKGLYRSLGADNEVPDPGSEDCLYLNVWSPQADAQKRPVMVWLHGGAFLVGSGSQPEYDGTGFATTGDLVIVTLNYRLGFLGFLHLGEIAGTAYTASGNCALLDQLAALQWVHENIAAFGGDPNNVTVFGESAGAMSIGALLTMPAAQGLFQRAILQSGAAHTVQTVAQATANASAFLELLGIKTDEIDLLADLPLEKLLDAQDSFLKHKPLGVMQPVIDGITIPESPETALADGKAKDIAVLIGTNRDEIKLFVNNGSESALDPGIAQRVLGDRTIEVFTTYAAARPEAGMIEIGLDMFTDYTFRIPAIRLAEHQVQHGAPVWFYRFDWPSPNTLRSACHALELPFVWNTLGRSVFSALLGDNPPRQLASSMQAAWIAFARTGNPNTSDLPPWPSYDTGQRATMLFHQQCEIINDPQGSERAVWKGLL
jgi:para-nitrobenzyl esterase